MSELFAGASPTHSKSMTAVSAWIDGMRRPTRAPIILLGVWLMTMLVSLPLTLVLRDMIRQHLGASLAGERATAGVDSDWMQEFGDQAAGIGITFKPTIIGFAAVLDNSSAFLDNTTRPLVVVGAASAYIGLWIFLAGGILDRYARERPTRADGFFSACGGFFFRFLRLAAVQWVVYAMLFGFVHRSLFDHFYPYVTRDLTVERTAFFIRVALYLVFGIALAAFNLVFDYAKVRAVVEDRRSIVGALGAAVRFIGRNMGASAGLYAANFVLFLLALAVYAAVAPGSGGAGATMWIGFAIGQIYVVARLWVKLVFWASETALFQSRFGHAAYVARPQPTWPDSPAADAI
jgi:hypothetical protein